MSSLLQINGGNVLKTVSETEIGMDIVSHRDVKEMEMARKMKLEMEGNGDRWKKIEIKL
jgi:hypothetical protein